MGGSSSVKKIIDGIIATEGGYVDDPNDSGGKTNYGITESVARSWGYTGDMRHLPIQTAFEIYKKRYWDDIGLEPVSGISMPVAVELCDTAVNMGPMKAGLFFQKSLNVFNRNGNLYPDITVDGVIGRKSVSAFQAFVDHRGVAGIYVMLKALNCLQGAAYIELAEQREKDEAFVYGWIDKRVVL